ncbi:MAG: hypothetical protein IPM39_10860 [Chloroflexi bacterium]|nr:hypothetical protein [Chloroflexota bacterium]
MASTNHEELDRADAARARAKHEKGKRFLLLGFVGLSVILIGLIWAEGLTTDQPATPSYYRERYEMDPNVYLTITAEAVEFRQQLNGTPAPDADEGSHGSGSGQGRGQGEATAVPTPTREATPKP